jgi:hypothetical protein
MRVKSSAMGGIFAGPGADRVTADSMTRALWRDLIYRHLTVA